MTEQPGQDTGQPDTMFSRDTDTLGQDGPYLAAYESEKPRVTALRGQQTAELQRPSYSPVAQPGNVTEIHWHTVRSEESDTPQREQPTRGMIGRLNGPDSRQRAGRGRRR
jgi:hypothetical protein